MKLLLKENHFLRYLLVLLFSCSKFVAAQSVCEISIKFNVNPGKYVLLFYNDKMGFKKNRDTIPVENNQCRFQWKFSDSFMWATLALSTKESIQIFGAKKSTININFTDSTYKEFSFSGDIARIQRYLIEKESFYTKLYEQYKKRNPQLSRPSFSGTDSFYVIQDSVFEDRIKYLKNYFQSPVTLAEKNFVKQQMVSMLYSSFVFKLRSSDTGFKKFAVYQRQNKTSNPFAYKFTEQINFNDRSNLKDDNFKNFVRSYFMNLEIYQRPKNSGKFSFNTVFDSIFSLIDKYTKDKFCAAMIKAIIINTEVRSMIGAPSNLIEVLPKYIELLRSEPKITEYSKLLNAFYEEQMSKMLSLKKGTPARSFTIVDSLGNDIKLQSFKGKLIYIDAWASWCGPCIASLPYWNKLVEKYKDKIAFVTISIDDSKEDWIKALKKHQPKGTHLLSAGGWESDFAKKYFISGVPAYVLIDKEGNILKMRADRPEEINLDDLIK